MVLRLLLVWLINAVALIAVAYLMPSITVSDVAAALVAALVLGLVNAVVRPVLVLLTLPVTILTLGLFIFVLNGLLFWGVASWLEGFSVAGFWSGVLGAILFSIVSWLLSALVQRGASARRWRATWRRSSGATSTRSPRRCRPTSSSSSPRTAS